MWGGGTASGGRHVSHSLSYVCEEYSNFRIQNRHLQSVILKFSQKYKALLRNGGYAYAYA